MTIATIVLKRWFYYVGYINDKDRIRWSELEDKEVSYKEEDFLLKVGGAFLSLVRHGPSELPGYRTFRSPLRTAVPIVDAVWQNVAPALAFVVLALAFIATVALLDLM